MGEIPLLVRKSEIALARKIEMTRMAFRRKMLESDYCARNAVDILQQVDDGSLSFDRTMKISTAEISIVEISTAEIGTVEIGAAEIGTAEIGTVEIGTAEIGTVEIGAAEIGATEIRTDEIGIA